MRRNALLVKSAPVAVWFASQTNSNGKKMGNRIFLANHSATIFSENGKLTNLLPTLALEDPLSSLFAMCSENYQIKWLLKVCPELFITQLNIWPNLLITLLALSRGATAGIVICKIEQFGEFSKTDCFNLRLCSFDSHENYTVTMFSFAQQNPKQFSEGAVANATEGRPAT